MPTSEAATYDELCLLLARRKKSQDWYDEYVEVEEEPRK